MLTCNPVFDAKEFEFYKKFKVNMTEAYGHDGYVKWYRIMIDAYRAIILYRIDTQVQLESILEELRP